MKKRKTTGRRVAPQYRGEQRNAELRDLKNQIFELQGDRTALMGALDATKLEVARFEQLIASSEQVPIAALTGIADISVAVAVDLGIHVQIVEVARWLCRRAILENKREFYETESSKSQVVP